MGARYSRPPAQTIIPNVVRELVVAFTPQTSETDAGIDLPSKAAILDVFVEVTTADSGITMDIGLLSSESGGDADGFLDGVSMASTGLVQGTVSVTKTAGANENYISAVSRTLGVLLADVESENGTDTAGDTGFCTVVRKAHLSDSVTAKSVSYTHSAGADTAAGYIHIIYIPLEA